MSEPPAEKPEARGANFVGEWYGHRVYPVPSVPTIGLDDQRRERCPFLSTALDTTVKCVKPPASAGVCTISTRAGVDRQDWIVCPYRVLDLDMWTNVSARLFGGPPESLLLVAGPQLAKDDVQRRVLAHLAGGERALVYVQDKLGGEISIARTPRSPEFSFDVTIAELILQDSVVQVGRYGILEIQTMDFHGSYRAVVTNLRDALRLHGDGFHKALQSNERWLSERIEGPNISNVFKRTFYQMMLKFQVGAQASCAGCVLAIPEAVWESWQRHLGAPNLVRRGDVYEMLAPDREFAGPPPAWIYVFDLDPSGPSPNPIRIKKVIATDAESVAHYALRVAPEAAVGVGGSLDRVPVSIALRLRGWWSAVERPPMH